MKSEFKASNAYQVAEVKVSYRPMFNVLDRPQITEPQTLHEVLIDSWDMDKLEYVEQFKMILLNTSNRILGIYEHTIGGSKSCFVDVKVLFTVALKANATKIILAHNHPSGSTKPSSQDIAITQKIQEAGKILEIEVLDHLIITKSNCYSFNSEGLL